jgi:hypothetical protein
MLYKGFQVLFKCSEFPLSKDIFINKESISQFVDYFVDLGGKQGKIIDK